MTRDNASSGERMKQSKTMTTDYKHYAAGMYRGLAEERYGEPRRGRVDEYENGPSPAELVAGLVGRGFTEEEAKEAVQALADDKKLGLYDRLLECHSCKKMAALGVPAVGGVRAVCNDCETTMRPFRKEADDADE